MAQKATLKTVAPSAKTTTVKKSTTNASKVKDANSTTTDDKSQAEKIPIEKKDKNFFQLILSFIYLNFIKGIYNVWYGIRVILIFILFCGTYGIRLILGFIYVVVYSLHLILGACEKQTISMKINVETLLLNTIYKNLKSKIAPSNEVKQ